MAKETLGNDSNGVGDMHHPCAEPVWRLPVHGARGRTLSLRPSLLLSALGGAFLTRTTAASPALCAVEQPQLAKKSLFAKAGPTTAGAADGQRVRQWVQDKKAGWYTVLADPRMPATSTLLDQAHNAIDRKLFMMKGFHHPKGS
jgi:hypothetical protein